MFVNIVESGVQNWQTLKSGKFTIMKNVLLTGFLQDTHQY